MKFGLFDHLERSDDRPLYTQFDERLEFAAAADEAGFYALQVAEHHSSPLNMVPVPGLWLSAVARATKQMRIGTLCYLLPLYSPLRLLEEICMLDQLSKGRLEIGIGRGVSPFEMKYHHVEHSDSREIMIDHYKCLRAGLGQSEFSYEGKHYQYKNVPLPFKPVQEGGPAFWYGSSNTTGAQWSGEHRMHFVANGGADFAKPNIDAYCAALAKVGGKVEHPKSEFPGGGVVGHLRHVVVADTDEEAVRIAKPAVEHHAGSLNWIRKRHNQTEFADRLHVHRTESFEDWARLGMVVAGSPETVVRELTKQAEFLGVNYQLLYMFFGTMTLPQALRSMHLFRNEVMPKMAHVGTSVPALAQAAE